MTNDIRYQATMYLLDGASIGEGTPLHDLLEGFGKRVLAGPLADLAEARALLERLDNANAAESRHLLIEALEASRAFLERTR